MGDDRRVVPLPRGVHHTEGERRALQRGAEPGPGEGGVALPLTPRREVIGAHRGGETGLFRLLHGGKQS